MKKPESAGKCAVCKKDAKNPVPSSGTFLCDSHFIRYVERKIKHGAREIGAFERKKDVGLVFGWNSNGFAALLVLAGIANERGTKVFALSFGGPKKEEMGFIERVGAGIGVVKIKKGETEAKAIARISKKLSLGFVASCECLEDSVVFGLAELLKKGKLSLPIISPLSRLYSSELEAYARLKGMKAEKREARKGIEDAIEGMVERLEAKHPGTKHKMLKSLLWLCDEKNRTGTGPGF